MARVAFSWALPWALPCAVAAALLAAPAASPALGQTDRGARVAPAEAGGARQALALEAGSGRVLALGGAAANVFVADPKVAEVRPASASSLFVFGVGAGRTTVAALDAAGRPVAQYEITVRPSGYTSGEAEAALARLLPGSRVSVTAQGKGLLLTGSVASAADSARAVAILRGFVPEGGAVENQLGVRSPVQVTLRVRIVEMQRSVTRALGIDWQALGSVGRFSVNFMTGNGLGVASAAANTLSLGTRDVNALIDALAQDNLLRVLAEPNLTVMSGQPASFLAGGEFPIPVGQQNNQVTVEFKRYGVTLAFVPTVLSDGQINLHVAPEVSQLSDQGAVRLSAGNSSLSIPALTVRRAETNVELGSGQSFAIAGLLQDNVTQTSSGVPFLGDLPVLGALFRSSGFQRQETELVILVTPYVVRPVNDPARLHTPADGYAPPGDFERILQLRQIGAQRASVPARIPGAAGFIVQ